MDTYPNPSDPRNVPPISKRTKPRGQPSIGDRNVNYFLPPCSATTRQGNPCKFPAHHGTGLCINHDPDYQEQQRKHRQKGSDNARKARSRPPINFEDINLSDRASIQALVEATIGLELHGALTTARARNLIRLLSIATRNLRNSNYGWVHPYDRQHAARYQYARTRLESQLAPLIESTPDHTE